MLYIRVDMNKTALLKRMHTHIKVPNIHVCMHKIACVNGALAICVCVCMYPRVCMPVCMCEVTLIRACLHE